jgi:hypothetical protein
VFAGGTAGESPRLVVASRVDITIFGKIFILCSTVLLDNNFPNYSDHGDEHLFEQARR